MLFVSGIIPVKPWIEKKKKHWTLWRKESLQGKWVDAEESRKFFFFLKFLIIIYYYITTT